MVELKPVLLTKWPNTNDADWCWSGTKASTPTMTATPMTCHQTLTSLSSATIRTPNWFSAPCSSRMRPNSRIVCHGRASNPNCRSRKAFRKKAAPKSMPAVTATWPRKFEPAGEPRPCGGVAPGQLGRPVVQAARRREARADLCHRQTDEQRHEPDEGPAPDDDHGAAGVQPVPVQGQAARQDGDDREGDGEVGEPGHVPGQLLRVAQLVQSRRVAVLLRDVGPGRGLSAAHARPDFEGAR